MRGSAYLPTAMDRIRNFSIIAHIDHGMPPGTGICHQVNLEYLARVVWTRDEGGGTTLAYPDTVIGTDSHTTMVNGLAVLGWGAGGIEAEAAMLGQAVSMLIPEVFADDTRGNDVDHTRNRVPNHFDVLMRQTVINRTQHHAAA